MKIFTEINGTQLEFEAQTQNGVTVLSQNGSSPEFDLSELGPGRYSLLFDNRSYLLHLHRLEDSYRLQVNGDVMDVRVEDERQKRLKAYVRQAGSGPSKMAVRAPIPGMVVSILVKKGQKVKKGDKLMVLEAMKMENVIEAVCDCTVQSVHVEEKQTVQQNQELIHLITENEA